MKKKLFSVLKLYVYLLLAIKTCYDSISNHLYSISGIDQVILKNECTLFDYYLLIDESNDSYIGIVSDSKEKNEINGCLNHKFSL